MIGVTCLKKINGFRCTAVNLGLFSFQMKRIILETIVLITRKNKKEGR